MTPLPASDPAPTTWRKSSRSNWSNQCVEVARIGAHIAIRDPKNPAAGHLTFDRAEWKAFLDRIKRGVAIQPGLVWCERAGRSRS